MKHRKGSVDPFLVSGYNDRMIKVAFNTTGILTTFSEVLDTDTTDRKEIRRLLNERVQQELRNPNIKVREIFYIEDVLQ